MTDCAKFQCSPSDDGGGPTEWLQTDVAIPLKPDPSVTKNITMQTETKLLELSGHLPYLKLWTEQEQKQELILL